MMQICDQPRTTGNRNPRAAADAADNDIARYVENCAGFSALARTSNDK